MRNDFLQIVKEAKAFLFEEKRKKGYFFSDSLQITPIARNEAAPKPVLYPTQPKPAPVKKVEEPAPTPSPAPKANLKEQPQAPPSALRKLIEKSCPHLKLKDSIPSDHFAELRKNAWKVRIYDLEILILEMSSDPKQKNLLANMANALVSLGKKAQLVDASFQEHEKSWDLFLSLPQLSLIIAPPLEAWVTPTLQAHLRMNPASKLAHLGNTRVLFLPPIEHLLSDLQLKLKVWKWLTSNLQA